MKQRPHRGELRVDNDGVRMTRDDRASQLRALPLIATVIIVSLSALLVILVFDRSEHIPGPDLAGHPPTDSPATTVAERAGEPTQVVESTPRKHVRTAVRRRNRGSAPGKRRSDEGEKGTGEAERQEIDARDYIELLRAGGETEGLAAFSPPGTRPPRTGVIVPDDYVLPEGFARHYQTTDDGRRLAPILTIAPEYELVDQEGNPVSLIDGYIVPPDFAPPDLPARMLEIPPQHDRGQSDR